jgi:hypothetical protein
MIKDVIIPESPRLPTESEDVRHFPEADFWPANFRLTRYSGNAIERAHCNRRFLLRLDRTENHDLGRRRCWKHLCYCFTALPCSMSAI